MHSSAGLGDRIFAGLLDFIILVIPTGIILYLVVGEFSLYWTQGLAWHTIYLIYLIVLPVIWKGYIIGKRVVNISVKKVNGEKLKLSDMFIREFIGRMLLSYITLGISVIVSAIMVYTREDKRAIHDLLAGTYVEDEI